MKEVCLLYETALRTRQRTKENPRMSLPLYDVTVPHFARLLRNIDKWLDKAEAHAKAKSFDANLYLSFRLAPDQFALVKQVAIATDSVKNGLARVTGKEAPAAFENKDATIADLRARLHGTIAHLETYSAKDFEGIESRKVALPGQQGKVAVATDHLFEHVVPTFFFHVNHSYAILRHNGVDLGKADYLGPKKTQDGTPS